MNRINKSTVASIVDEHPAAVHVMRALRIDYCCEGGETLERACELRGLRVDSVVGAIERASAELPSHQRDIRGSGSAIEIVSTVVAESDGPLRAELDAVFPLLTCLDGKRGDLEREFREMRQLVDGLVPMLAAHLDAEWRLLPLLEATRCSKGDPSRAHYELGQLDDEHRLIGAILDRLRDLSDGFVAPASASSAERKLACRYVREFHLVLAAAASGGRGPDRLTLGVPSIPMDDFLAAWAEDPDRVVGRSPSRGPSTARR